MHLGAGSWVPRERPDRCGGRSGEVGRLWKRNGGAGRGGAGFRRGRILGVRGGFGHGRVAAGGWEGGVWCPSEVSVVEEEVCR